MKSIRGFWLALACFAFALLVGANRCASQESAPTTAIGIGNWLTFTANVPEAGFRRTVFFLPHYNTGVVEWDSRAEVWLPPFRDKFSWGLYLKLSGIAGFKNVQSLDAGGFQGQVFPNAWLGGPGAGLQVYPFSSWRFQGPNSRAGKVLGPLRFFAEYNRTDYWGMKNSWRPRNQTRVGFEYWKAMNVNEPRKFWWVEIWNGLYWQSSNEFTDRYDTVIFANAWRGGLRKPRSGAISTFTPYVAIESSRTKYNRMGTANCVFSVQQSDLPPNPNPNPCDFYWENRLLGGAGLRFAPSLKGLRHENQEWLNRFVIYGEYLNTAAYYGPTAPSTVPRFDIRAGVSASLGQWYK